MAIGRGWAPQSRASGQVKAAQRRAGGDDVNDQSTADLSYGARPLSPADAAGAPTDLDAAPAVVADAAPENAARPSRFGRRQTGHKPAQGMSDDDSEDMTPTHKRRRAPRMADSGRMPALRLNRYVGRAHAERRSPAMVYDTEHAPGHLRLTRLVMGLALLAVAWVASLLVVALTESLLTVFPHQPSLTTRFGLYVLGAIGIIWLAVVALALIVVGAFSLALALTRRGW